MGREVRVRQEEELLLLSLSKGENSEAIAKKLKKGSTLIVDRYSYSGVAFSNAKGLDLNWCLAPEKGLPGEPLFMFVAA